MNNPLHDLPTSESAPPSSVARLILSPRRVLLFVFLFCGLAELTFFLLDWHINYGRVAAAPIRNLLNTTREDGLASWFGVTQTAFVALTLWVVFLTVRAREYTRWVVLGWLLLALLFSYMAFDDGSAFHERMGSTFKLAQKSATKTGSGVLSIFPSYPWQVLFLPLFAAAGLFMLVFLWLQFKTLFPRLLLLGGIGCFVFAVGLDFVEGLEEDHPLNLNAMIGDIPFVIDYAADRFDRKGYTAVRHFQKSLEETMEMFGMTLLWLSFLHYWMGIATEFRIRWTGNDLES